MKKPKVVQVIYLGERVAFLGKIYQLFRDANGKEYNFRGIKGVYFGSVYEVTDDRINLRPEAVESKLTPTDEDRLLYENHKLQATQERNERKKAMQLKKPHANITRAIELLRPFVRSVGLLDQKRFMAYIHDQASKKGKK